MSFGEVKGTTLKKWVLLRKVYLQELLQIETKPCALCDLDREIIYSASYDRDLNVECFDVCQLCGIELIQVSDAIIRKQDAPNEGMCPVCHTLGEMFPCVQCGKPFFVADWESEIGEPKICSKECADKWSR